MTAQRFGSAHTEKKLQKVSAYLERFTTVLKNQPFKTLYVDAFAGTGAWGKKDDADRQLELIELAPIAKGSAKRALEVKPPFSHYIFIEKSPRKFRELLHLQDEYPDQKDRMTFLNQDANIAILDLCRNTDWRLTRAVVFLDPFGMQVNWSTVEVLAKTKAVDLFYLVPTGIGINRQIPRVGEIPKRRGERIDIVLGTTEWRQQFTRIEQSPSDLFGLNVCQQVKVGNVAAVTEFVLERLRSIFAGGVAEKWLLLGKKGLPMYSLVFACANPNKKASSLALRLANAILK